MKLAIGQGPNPQPEYDLHLDARALPGVDIVAPWQSASFAPTTFDYVFSSQTLEHLNRADQELALRRTLTWLKPQAVLEVWTPCIETQVRWVTEGSITWDWFQQVMYGEADYLENTHKWMHTVASLHALASECGYEVLSCEEVHGSIRLVARRPEPKPEPEPESGTDA